MFKFYYLCLFFILYGVKSVYLISISDSIRTWWCLIYLPVKVRGYEFTIIVYQLLGLQPDPINRHIDHNVHEDGTQYSNT